MTNLRLAGDIWTETLLQRVFGAGGSPATETHSITCSGLRADRALFFARVAGLTIDENADPPTIFAPDDADSALYAQAAEEIMGYYGRISAEDLAARRQMIFARAVSVLIAAQNPAPASLRSSLGTGQVATLTCQTPHEGYFLTRAYRLRHPQFAGEMTEPLTREVFVATDAAIVLPYDPVRDHVLLVEQFRMGPFGRGDPLPWVLEPVAGRVDAAESPAETAHRECREEADLALDKLEHVTSHYCSPGCSTEMFHCFVGLCDLPDTGHSHGGLETENEDLRRHVITFDHAMELTGSGEINIGPLFALLLWLERERPRLRASA